MINEDIPAKDPVSPKVSVGTLGGAAVGVLTWVLTFFVPAWQSAIPGALAPLIPVLTSAIGFYATGWSVRHPITTSRIINAIRKGEVTVAEIEAIVNPGIPAPSSSGGPVSGTFTRVVKDRPQA